MKSLKSLTNSIECEENKGQSVGNVSMEELRNCYGITKIQ